MMMTMTVSRAIAIISCYATVARRTAAGYCATASEELAITIGLRAGAAIGAGVAAAVVTGTTAAGTAGEQVAFLTILWCGSILFGHWCGRRRLSKIHRTIGMTAAAIQVRGIWWFGFPV